MMNVFTAVLLAFMICSSCSNATVTLSSSADSLCPGDGVVFTCVTETNTGRLVWDINYSTVSFHSPTQLNNAIQLDTVFNVTLLNITGNIYYSTATAVNIPTNYNCVTVACGSGQTEVESEKKESNLIIDPPPSPPLNLTYSYALSSVTISWVAPLDTPLCVHSYTVTVRNNCNSSQVMVYNTTDNRSSLSITDLTSDGEYSVTVAGRDGAGRLGQESENLTIIIKKTEELQAVCSPTGFLSVKNNTVFIQNQIMGVFLQWKTSCFASNHSFLIKHDVSSDQSPITTNRPNITLYGVQPGETYTVEIKLLNVSTSTKSYANITKLAVTIPSTSPVCLSTNGSPADNQFKGPGVIATITSSVVLVVVLCGYLVVCVVTKLAVPSSENSHMPSTDVALDSIQHPNPSFNTEENCRQRLGHTEEEKEEYVPSLAYDYVRHQ